MQIHVLSKTTQSGIDNVETVHRRASSLLDRFSHRITALHVQLDDLNGPKGGVDRHCSMKARLDDGSEFLAHARSAHIPSAVDSAMRRVARSIDACNKRKMSLRRTAILAP